MNAALRLSNSHIVTVHCEVARLESSARSFDKKNKLWPEGKKFRCWMKWIDHPNPPGDSDLIREEFNKSRSAAAGRAQLLAN